MNNLPTLAEAGAIAWENRQELLLATLAITSITKGSGKFAELETDPPPPTSEITRTTREATGMIAVGGAGMLTLAAVAGEETYAHPEIVLLTGSSLNFLRNLSTGINTGLDQIRARTLVSIAAVIMGTHTLANHSTDFISALPPVGLTLLTMAYSMGGIEGLKKVYRKLTTVGGAFVTAGAAGTALASLDSGNEVSLVMSVAYFILAGYFTLAEVLQFCRTHGITLDVAALKKRLGINPTE